MRLVALYEETVRRELPQVLDEASEGPAELHWYVLCVSPLCEKAVSNRLKGRIGRVATYWPVTRRKVRRRGSRIEAETLLMPRYLFVGFEASDPPWLYVREIRGVQGVLGVDGRPMEVAATMVGALMFRCQSGQLDPPDPPKVQRGMRVVASDGVMRGFEGDVVDIHKRNGSAQVLFEMFSKVPVTIHLDALVSVSYAYDRMRG